MMNIKRILWVEDNERELNDSIRNLFVDVEKKSIGSMQNALKEISSEHLYDYDTIVLDIDFRHDNSSDFQEVIRILKSKIYLSKDQCKVEFIQENGGYLIFLYLLERGYPSDRIAFLTGNQDIIDELLRYTLMNRNGGVSREEIVDLFEKIWVECNEDYEEFERQIYNLSGIEAEYCLDPKYTETEFVYECIDALEDGEHERLVSLIKGVQIVSYDSQKDDGENSDNKNSDGKKYKRDMIFRFHHANLESPVYFSKHTNDIPEHNLADASEWIKTKGSSDRIFRWLVLNACDYIEKLWQRQAAQMTSQVRSILKDHNDNNSDYDFGIRNGFRQMFFVFDGLKAIEHAGVHYQAVSAMLTPFESMIKTNVIRDSDLEFRRRMAFNTKKARNYCAHNYFGTSISDKTALYMIMITMTAILDRTQREQFTYWYERVRSIIVEDNVIPDVIDETVIDNLLSYFWTASPCRIDDYHCSVPQSKPLSNYGPDDYLVVFGWHNNMKTKTSCREKYYIFTLAAHIVKVLSGSTDIIRQYGQSVNELYNISKYIVSTYNYSED